MNMVEAIRAIETAKAEFMMKVSSLVTGISTHGFPKVTYACCGIDFRVYAVLPNGKKIEVFACHREDGNKNVALGFSYQHIGGEWDSRYSADDTWHGLAIAVIDYMRGDDD